MCLRFFCCHFICLRTKDKFIEKQKLLIQLKNLKKTNCRKINTVSIELQQNGVLSVVPVTYMWPTVYRFLYFLSEAPLITYKFMTVIFQKNCEEIWLMICRINNRFKMWYFVILLTINYQDQLALIFISVVSM